MEFGVLGPLQVNGDGAVLSAKQRILLAVLLLHANRVVPVEALIDAVWDDAPPSSARVTLQGYVKQLRQNLGAPAGKRLVTRFPGYLMVVAAGELDLDRFTGLCDQARSAVDRGDWPEAARLFGEALSLWRGDPLADVPAAAVRRTEVPRLAELRMRAVESRVDADLRLGRHRELVAELRGLAGGEPLREELHGYLMLALYRCGRQAEALEIFRGIDQRLRGELGISPGPELQHLHQRILTADPSLTSGQVSHLNIPPGHAGAARLEESRRGATTDRIEAGLAAAAVSDAAGLITELRALVAEDPLAERPRALLMRALYLADRQADALAVYADAREQFAAQLGVDPPPQLEQVYLGVLRRSLPEARFPHVGTDPTAPGPTTASRPIAASGSAETPPTTLRVPLTSLVGRDDLAARAEALTDENRLVTLTGPGGVGKTRLAAEVASRVAARGRGAVWLADLVPLSDPGDVPYSVLAAVGIREGLRAGAAGGEPGQAAEPGASPVPGPSGRLVLGLRERSGLLVLDNCEHLIDAVAGLADAVLSGCPGIKILAASREALGITGETVCPVSPLPVPPASGAGGLAAIAATASVRLLADRARAVRPGFTVTDANAADVAGICRVLDGMPLAIELAAARLRTMSSAQLIERLGDRFAVLNGGSRTALPRHRTLRAVVDWSWDLLSQPERALARRLAVLPAGATLESAERICCDEPDALSGDLPADAVLDALTGLADKSFLTVTEQAGDSEPRYRMLDTIRAYCLERLAEAGEEDSVRDRMSGYYLALAETAEPLLRTRAQLRWLDVLAAENGNMHAAVRWLIGRGDADAALRFCAALCWYWYLCGQVGDRGALVKGALALDAAGPRHEDRAMAEARTICEMTVAMCANWDVEAARESLDAAVAADPSGRLHHPVILLGQAVAARFSDNREHWLEVLAGYFDSADPWTGAAVRMMSAVILFGLGRIEEASLGLDAALTAFRDIGEIWGIGTCLMNRADLCKIAGDYRGAIMALEEAAAPGRQLGSSPDKDLTWLHSDLAWLRVRTGDYAAAHAALDLADQKARAWGDPGRYQRLIRAELAWREGNAAEATRLCESILRKEAGKPVSQASLRALAGVRLGVLTLEAGDIARGTALLREALSTAATIGDRLSTATAVEGLAVAALRTARAERAAALLGAADSIRGAADHSSLDAPGIRATAKDQLGEAAFDAAYQRGLSMSYDEAFGFAQAGGGSDM